MEHVDSLALWTDISNDPQCLVNNSESVVAWGYCLSFVFCCYDKMSETVIYKTQRWVWLLVLEVGERVFQQY